jgi:hypothetical protein
MKVMGTLGVFTFLFSQVVAQREFLDRLPACAVRSHDVRILTITTDDCPGSMLLIKHTAIMHSK